MAISEFDFEDLFPITVMKVKLELPHSQISNYTKEFISSCPNYTTFFNSSVNNSWIKGLSNREELERSIHNCCELFLRETGRRESVNKKLDYWGNVYEEGDWHEPHIHPNSLLSGTYYPYSDENSSQIQFFNPNAQSLMMDTITNVKTYMKWAHKPLTGDLLIWPSWLVHVVQPQKKIQHPRVSISFNYK